jgi:hypothetical protein
MRKRALVPVLSYQVDKPVPPDISIWDQTEAEKIQNDRYCKELQRAMWEYEMNPRNFFRLNKFKG